MTEADVRHALEAWEGLRKRAIEVGRELITLHDWKCSLSDDASIEIESHENGYKHVFVHYWQHREEDSIHFSLAYLWQPDWAERERARLDAEKAEAAAKKAKQVADIAETMEAHERREYARLWEKFGGREP